MSRGLGHVQRTILAMIEAEPHGALTVEEICPRIYPTEAVEKKHRVAVLRAVRRMKLPGTWKVRHAWSAGSPCCLFDECDDESQMRAVFEDYSWASFERWKESEHGARVRLYAAEAREYRDASPVKKLEIEIERKKNFLASFGDLGGQIEERVAALEVERNRLAAEQLPAVAA
jgi:hypothetical protein